MSTEISCLPDVPKCMDSPPDSVGQRGARPSELVRIRASAGWRALNLGELWRYRELLWFLALRDIQVRYKQTAFGVAWAVLQPLLAMFVFTIIFGVLANVPSDGVPYALFALVGLLPWQLFAYALTQSSQSLVTEQRLITKVYFPRLIVPLASVISGLADFTVAFVLVLGAMVFFAVAPSWNLLAVPALVLFAIATALSVGLWLAALNVEFRDVRYAMPFLTQLWMYATPVAYPSSLVPEAYRPLYGLNPMAGVVEGFRWALLGIGEPPTALMGVSVLTVVVLLAGGLFYFRRLERQFADIV
jgi:lipopolysaccharide transport system permease protein